MPMLPDRRALLPACLTLGSLLCALPALADAPAAPAVAIPAQTITLQHVVPGDILKALHWNPSTQRFDLPAPFHVEGVTQISAQPATNSLSVVATPAGFAQVRSLVRLLDFVPRQVQIKFALANAAAADLDASGIDFALVPYPNLEAAARPEAGPVSSTAEPTFLRYATGKDVALFLQALTKRGAVVQSPTITTTNNVDASLSLSTTSPSPGASSVTFAATPRINSDDSVTLVLHPSFSDGTHPQEIKTLRTVKSGDTMVMVMPPPSSNTGGKDRLLFVTPTILSTDKGPATMTVK